jgi:transcriptional regulator with XRE-family HTH domain
MDSTARTLGTKIKALRGELGVSQEQLAAKLGISRVTLSQIENGERKVTADDLRTLSRVLNVSSDQLLDLATPVEVVLAAGRHVSPEGRVERIHVPRNHVQKFKEVLLYLLGKVGSKPNIGETVIYKLLYFMDFDYYEKYEEQMIGATYIKNHHGPTPVEFRKIVDQMIREKAVEKVKSVYFSFPQTKYLPLRPPNLALLNARELDLINDVLRRLSDKNATEISDYSHQDVPWLTAEKGQPIQYESVFYRTAPYSTRTPDGEVQ